MTYPKLEMARKRNAEGERLAQKGNMKGAAFFFDWAAQTYDELVQAGNTEFTAQAQEMSRRAHAALRVHEAREKDQPDA